MLQNTPNSSKKHNPSTGASTRVICEKKVDTCTIPCIITSSHLDEVGKCRTNVRMSEIRSFFYSLLV